MQAKIQKGDLHQRWFDDVMIEFINQKFKFIIYYGNYNS